MNRSRPIEVGKTNWRLDGDGMLRVTANILKEGVFPYRPDAGYPEELAQKDQVLEFISRRQFTADALASLEGKPVLIGVHEMQIAGGPEAGGDWREIGSVAGKPAVSEDGFIRADLLISDPEAIRRIQERDLIEVSAGYRSLVLAAPGDFAGAAYDVEQTELRFNHVLVLPYGKGRCGREVRILNQKEETAMPITVTRAFGERRRDYLFHNQRDAEAAEAMARDCEAAAAERANAMEAAAADKDRENQCLAADKAGLEERLAKLEAELLRLLRLEEREQAEDEEAILAEELEAGDDRREAEAARRDIAQAGSLAERRAAVVRRAARLSGVAAEAWSQDQIDANFAMLAVRARKAAEKRRDAGRSSKVEGVKSNSLPGCRPGVRERLAAGLAERKG